MRSCIVEIDKTTATEWPPESVEHDGGTHTLASIYAKSNFRLTVQRGDAELKLPSSGPDFDLAQLHEFMLKHRRQEPGSWHAHVLIVPNIEYVSNWRRKRPLGVMYDWRAADANSTPREGCAISHGAVSAHGQRAYLRTLAHELGHVLNLQHPKQEDPPQAIGTTLMNQTGDLQRQGPYPDNISYNFNAKNSSWLLEGPADFVRPGGRPYASRPADPNDLVPGVLSSADVPAADTPDLEFTLSTRRESYSVGEPFYVRFSLRNHSDRTISVDPSLSPHNQSVVLDVVDPVHHSRRFRPAYIECSDAPTVKLAPGQEILGNAVASFDARGQVFPSAGTYRLRARYAAAGAAGLVQATAHDLAVEITQPKGAAAVKLADTASLPDVGLFFILRGGRHLAKAAASWRHLIEQVSDAPFAQSVKVALAQYELSKHDGQAAARRAVDLLESAEDGDLDYEQVAERGQLLTSAATRLGRKKMIARAESLLREAATRITPSAFGPDS